MRRLFWITVGATAGVLVVRKIQKTAHAYSPSGLAERAGGLGESLRYFVDEVRAGMAEREHELREALGLAEADPRADGAVAHDRDPRRAAELLEHPSRPPTRRSAG